MKVRPGVSLVETVLVLAIAGILLAVAVPRFSTISASGAVRNGQTRLVSAIATARAAAIQRGGNASFKLAGNRVTVVANAGTLNLISPVPMDTLYQVAVTTSPATSQVDFDGRGFASNIPSGVTFVLRRTGIAPESVCVTKLGVVRRTCESL